MANPTYTIKGFLGFSAWVSNDPNVIATLGELSSYSRTFTRDQQLFGGTTTNANPIAMDLTVFSAEVAAGGSLTVPPDYVANLMTIGDWLYSNAIDGHFTADPTVFQQAFLAQFGSLVQNVILGTMTNVGTVWLPDALEFFFINPSSTAPTATASTRVKLWFADGAFQTEYDEFSISFVPPLPNLDNFFLTAAQIQTALSQQTTPVLFQRVAQARNNQPESILDAQIFNWIDPVTTGNFIPTSWSYLIYGAAGNNLDTIKQQLVTYILANSTHSEADWEKIFPDIFTSTEFILTPLWNQIAIPNQTLNVPGNVYSPTVNQSQALNIAIETANGTGYTDEFVGNVINVVPVPFKSMSLTAVGGPQNRGGISEFRVRWPDYINVSTTSTDFDRMTLDTQGFVTLMATMLQVAETMTATSDIPPNKGLSRLTRNDASGQPVLYLTASYDQVTYLMVAKSWMDTKYPPETGNVGSIGITYGGTFVNGAFQLLNSSEQMTLQFGAANAIGPLKFEILDTTISDATINLTSGLFVGNFPTVGLYNLTLKLTDSTSTSTQRTFVFNYQQPTSGGGTTPPLTLGPVNAPAGTVGISYVGNVQINGGQSPYTIVGSPTLPAGLVAQITGAQIILGGTPTTPGNAPVNIQIQDSSGSSGGQAKTASTQFNITISAEPQLFAIGTTNVPNAVEGKSYTGSIRLTGGTPPYTQAAGAPTMPAGLSIAQDGTNLDTWNITGQTTFVGGSEIDVTFNDNAGASVTYTNASFQSTNPITFTGDNITTPIVTNQAYSGTLNISNGVGPFTLVTAGTTLPAGLTAAISGTTITVSGTATTPNNNFALAIEVQGANNETATFTKTVQVQVPA